MNPLDLKGYLHKEFIIEFNFGTGKNEFDSSDSCAIAFLFSML